MVATKQAQSSLMDSVLSKPPVSTSASIIANTNIIPPNDNNIYMTTPTIRTSKGRFVKGLSGNPSGRPRMPVSLALILKQLLLEHPEDAKEIVASLIQLGKRGDLGAVRELFERIDGKVVERKVIGGELPIKLVFVPASQLIAAQNPQLSESKMLSNGKEG